MAKYELRGLVTEVVNMEVEADNLQEAIDKCYAEYDINEIDDVAAITVDEKILEDTDGYEIYLCDISVADRVKY